MIEEEILDEILYNYNKLARPGTIEHPTVKVEHGVNLIKIEECVSGYLLITIRTMTLQYKYITWNKLDKNRRIWKVYLVDTPGVAHFVCYLYLYRLRKTGKWNLNIGAVIYSDGLRTFYNIWGARRYILWGSLHEFILFKQVIRIILLLLSSCIHLFTKISTYPVQFIFKTGYSFVFCFCDLYRSVELNPM